MPGVMPKSNRLAVGEKKLCTLTSQSKIKMDSGFRRNDELRRASPQARRSLALQDTKQDRNAFPLTRE